MAVTYLKKEGGTNASWSKGQILKGGITQIAASAPHVYSETLTAAKAIFENIPFSFYYDYSSGELVGQVAVFVNGKLQARNIPNASNSSHQYYEVQTGYDPVTLVPSSNKIIFNTTFPVGTEITFLGFFAPYDVSGVDRAQIATNTLKTVDSLSIANGNIIATINHSSGVIRPIMAQVYMKNGSNWDLQTSGFTCISNSGFTQTIITNVSLGTNDFKVIWM